MNRYTADSGAAFCKIFLTLFVAVLLPDEMQGSSASFRIVWKQSTAQNKLARNSNMNIAALAGQIQLQRLQFFWR